MAMKESQQKSRVLFPIGAKLVIIISILLLVSLGAVILMVSVLSTQEVRKTAEDNNFTVNRQAASQVESDFKSVQASVLLYLEMMDLVSPDFNRNPEMERYFFSHNRGIVAIEVTRHFLESENNVYIIPNTEFINSNNLSAADAEIYLAEDFPAIEGELRLFNASPVFQLSMITAVFIRQSRAGNSTIKVLFTPDELSESMSTGTNTSFLINGSGDLLLHPDNDLVLGGANFSTLPIASVMRQQGDNNRQVSYTDGGKEYFGAYYLLADTDVAVITTIPYDIVFEAVQGLTRQNLFLTVGVLFISIIFIWFFSKTISVPARLLADGAVKIEEGDFTLNLKKRTSDELGLLTESYNKMSSALNIFGRFTNKDIAIRAMRGEIKPGGLPKHATVFFSDIRNFTEKSENFTNTFGDDAPDRIVQWLNDYFSHMIQCVEKTSGVVDKFVGDALMAHWGTASTAGNAAEDAFNCVKTALLMREALLEINAQRSKNDPGNPAIRIGCGINTGMVIAGQIGSDERMEYTVIGDPVNLANRIEALNKPFGTDILISENTLSLTGDKFITEEMPPVTVKGKEKPVRVFAVVNFRDAEGPQNLAQVRALLDIDPPDLRKVDFNAEETKYRIPPRKKIRKGEAPEIILTSPGPSELVQGYYGRAVPVFFIWSTSNFNLDTHVIVEVAGDPHFVNIVEGRDVRGAVAAIILLEDGQYWWRAYPADGYSMEPVSRKYPTGVLMVDTDAKKYL